MQVIELDKNSRNQQANLEKKTPKVGADLSNIQLLHRFLMAEDKDATNNQNFDTCSKLLESSIYKCPDDVIESCTAILLTCSN